MKISRTAVLAAFLLAGCAGVKEAAAPPKTDPEPVADFGTYLSARFAASEHDLGDAERFYRESLKADPADPMLLGLSFFYTTAAGDMGEAGALAERVVSKAPGDRAARLALAMVALKKGDFAGTRTQLAASSKGPFTTLTVSLLDAWAAAGAGDAAASANDMKTLAAQEGAQGMANFHMALLAEFTGRNEAAEEAYRKAVSGSGASPRVVEAYGSFLERAGRTDDARALYAKLAGDQALAPVVEAGLARIAKGTRPDALVATPQQGVAEGLFGIAASLNDQASTDVSILYLRFALYLRPDLALADILLADRFERLEKYDDAIAAYRQVEKGSPYFRMAAVAAAIDESREKKTDAAIADLKALAEGSPRDADGWIALGDTYRAAEKYQDAIGAYDRAVQVLSAPQAKDWSLFYARATAEDRAHHWPDAEADLDHALKLSPNEPDVLNFLGYSWVDQGKRIPEALAMLEKARSLSPYNGYIVDSVGWAYYRLGRYADAARTLEQAVLLVPGDPTINDHFGDALWNTGRRMEARFQWNHALAFDPDADEKATIEQKLLTGPKREKPA